MDKRYKLFGANGSPYSVKVRAALRYRRIPFDWVRIEGRNGDVLKHVKVPVIPVLQTPDGHYINDSTPLLVDLDQSPHGRHIIPEDPALAFLVYLIEDMADEWLTKIMFHYRWHDPVDQAYCAQWIARDRVGPAGEDVINETAAKFRSRQVDRMPLVGVQAANRQVIVESYRRLLACLHEHLASAEFLFGSRPSLADFAVYGQLWDLGIDPTPTYIMKHDAPRVHPWLLRVDDLSGHEGGTWIDLADQPSKMLGAMLALSGEVYLPFLMANARAVADEADTFSVELLGSTFTQAPFRYQAKCLERLRALYKALLPQDRDRIDPLLTKSHCLDALKSE